MSAKILRILSSVSKWGETLVCVRETGHWCAVTLAYLGVRNLQFPYKLHLRSGEILTLNERTDLIIFWLVFIRRHYPVKASDRVILDIGANIGIFTIYAAHKRQRVGLWPWSRFQKVVDDCDSISQRTVLRI